MMEEEGSPVEKRKRESSSDEESQGNAGQSGGTVGPARPANLQVGPAVPPPRKKKKRGIPSLTIWHKAPSKHVFHDRDLKSFAVLQFEQLYMERLPSAEMYERSYMHRDNVTHTAISKKDFIITGSRDGHVKFWKKKPQGIEFVKHFRAHLGTPFHRHLKL